MPTIVKMPKWGLTMTSGTITDWLRAEGTTVSAGDLLLTVETEKAVNDVEAPADGTLVRIVADAGAEVAVSGPIAIIAAPGEELSDADITALLEQAKPARAAGRAASTAGTARSERAPRQGTEGRVNASPAAKKRAAELGVDLALVEATGPGGRITSDDVERAALDIDEGLVEERLDLAGGEVYMLKAGLRRNPRVVFLHGLGGSQSTWQIVLGGLAEEHRVVALDLPGHGQSHKRDPDSFDYSLTGLAETVVTALDASGESPAILIGHSLGGAVALQVALLRPDLVRALVLVNSAGLGGDISPELAAIMAGQPGANSARDLLALFFADQRLVTERGIAEMAANQEAEGGWAAQQAVATLALGQDVSDGIAAKLGEIGVPVLIVWGAADRVIDIERAYAALSLLPDAELRVLPGIGHVPQVEDPERLTTAIERFVRSLG